MGGTEQQMDDEMYRCLSEIQLGAKAMRGIRLATVLTLAPFAGEAQQTAGDERSEEILRLVASTIVASHSEREATIVGIPDSCRESELPDFCAGRRYSSLGVPKVEFAAQAVARALGVAVSANAVVDRARYLEPPSGQATNAVRCGSARGPYVLTLFPSIVRETTPGTEWRVVVLVHETPVRRECLQSANLSDYVVAILDDGRLWVKSVVAIAQASGRD
jgi:hypothetical protein